jgi:hypothetical protein
MISLEYDVFVPKISLGNGNITSFEGDAIVIPSDVELTNKKTNKIVEAVLETGNDDLTREISSIGFCEMGNAVITQGYNLKAKHLIFLPYCDSSNEENRIDFVLLHKALRSVFTLASLYNVKTLAIPIFRFKVVKLNFIEKILNIKIFRSLFGQEENNGLKESEVEDIIVSISSEFKDTSIKEVCIYK